MRRSELFLLLFLLFISGCGNTVSTEPKKIHWDRDMCQRCKMLISDRNHAVQTVNPKNAKVYKFDDIGCAVLWFEENEADWLDKAVIWITETDSGKWIDAKNAFYGTKSITPMAYGFSAYEEKKDNSVTFDEMRLRMLRGEHMANRYIKRNSK